jgi:phosphoglycerate-specific signal transduction histidine kinase
VPWVGVRTGIIANGKWSRRDSKINYMISQCFPNYN